jgi:surfactin synthase thioesterase subunit
MAATPYATWLQCATPRPDAPRRLVCFPHAGGSASFFSDWGKRLQDCEVHAVRYPGRAERIGEPAPSDLKILACDIADAVERIADRPVLLFGHSMGAVVALETARFLEARDVRVAHLFASGSRNGHRPISDLPAGEDDDDDDDAVASRLVSLGGTQRDIAGDSVFRDLVLPYVRSDTRMFHRYAMRPEPRLRCGITTVVGDADGDADRRPWRELTMSGLDERSASGGHFFLVSAPPFAVVQDVLQSIGAATPAPALAEGA